MTPGAAALNELLDKARVDGTANADITAQTVAKNLIVTDTKQDGKERHHFRVVETHVIEGSYGASTEIKAVKAEEKVKVKASKKTRWCSCFAQVHKKKP